MRTSPTLRLLAAVLFAAAGGCGPDTKAVPAAPAPGNPPVPQPAKPADPAPAAKVSPPVFEERAVQGGITFRMALIPPEQGENFKINLYDHGCGVAVADFDGDGRDDVFFLNQVGTNALYHNDGGGRFTDVTAAAGADLALADRMCVAATFGDVDGDGRPDLYVTTTRGGNVLFRNEGGGRFTDVTKQAGLELVRHSEGAAFFDADRDGDLDLLVCNTAHWTNDQRDAALGYYPGPALLFDMFDRPIETNVYYRNDGEGRFTDATRQAGLAGFGWSAECAVFDYDGDGAPDVFVSNMFGASTLYRNDGDGHFADRTASDLNVASFGALGARAFDFDLDGRLDLMVADMHSDMWIPPEFDVALIEEKRKYAEVYGPMLALGKMTTREAERYVGGSKAGPRAVVYGNTLYRNLGGGGFAEVSDAAGAETFQPWGVVPADFRNEGAEDVFMPSGMGHPFFVWRNAYLLNQGGGKFVEASARCGLDPPPGGPFQDAPIGGKKAARSSRSAATADFDGDGRLDLVVNNFNERAYLYMNRSPERGWIEFRLTGTKSNRDAVGALVVIKAGGRRQVRQVQTAGGYLSQSSRTLHFGLGDLKEVQSAEILWPSGLRQTIENPAAGRRHEVLEPTK